MMCFKQKSLPARAVWVGFYHGYFLVPKFWLNGPEHRCNSAVYPVEPFPEQWLSVDFELAFPVEVKASPAPVFVVKLIGKNQQSKQPPPLPAGYCNVRLKESLGCTDMDIFALLSRAAQVLRWEKDFRFCPRCAKGLETPAIPTICRGCAACELTYYPPISPCVLVLVVREHALKGPELLLAHGVRHPPGLWSVLAGFIEAGESVEAAAKREVQEEVGLSISNLRYRGSQSWPFPHALMLGFWATADSEQLLLDPEEICEARWFNLEVLDKCSEVDGFSLPRKGSLSRALIDDYLALSR